MVFTFLINDIPNNAPWDEWSYGIYKFKIKRNSSSENKVSVFDSKLLYCCDTQYIYLLKVHPIINRLSAYVFLTIHVESYDHYFPIDLTTAHIILSVSHLMEEFL